MTLVGFNKQRPPRTLRTAGELQRIDYGERRWGPAGTIAEGHHANYRPARRRGADRMGPLGVSPRWTKSAPPLTNAAPRKLEPTPATRVGFQEND